MKHGLIATANAAAVTVGVVYIVCAVLIAFVPELSMAVAQSWFHGIDISKIGSWNITVGSLLLGLITAAGAAWAVGFLFAYIYNLAAKK